MDAEQAFTRVTGVLQEQLGTGLRTSRERAALMAVLERGHERADGAAEDYDEAVDALAAALVRTGATRIEGHASADGATPTDIEPGVVEASLRAICPLWPFC
ncbi:hypothetical protein [Janibacter alittae]|uniref:Uncharacterized protein n=1 Tax=Janibacter alittae TaxID=3115209 RepID=A0ABZ2MGB4_9MICO